MKRFLLLLTVLITGTLITNLLAQQKGATWNFESLNGRNALEAVSGSRDTLEGYFEPVPGIDGQGIRLDGFTTCLRSGVKGTVVAGTEFTVEAWVALGNYPWNWCPVLTSETNETKGFRMMLGPLGEASFEVAIGEKWITCATGRDAIPLRTWMHLVGIYRANERLELYVNGQLAVDCPLKGSPVSWGNNLLIGMVAEPGKPSDIHRTWGTIASFYGIDGILDEVSLYKTALSEEQIKAQYRKGENMTPDIAPRKLPVVEKNPGKFGAYYTHLKYYPGWDQLWPVDEDPDIVVCFEKSPVKLIFWRGIRYGASWVSENDLWMTDQSVEAWGEGENDNEGCYEHMQDRHCRFSHVRIIENTPARVVVHWRYAPVSAYNNTWRIDPKTGWECWIDEYYYIYPDASAIRKVSWKKGTLGYPRQFQETLALLQPGDVISDLLEIDNAHVADYEGKRGKQSFVEDPSKAPYGPWGFDTTFSYTIQQYGFKSQNKPFICFEPGNQMFLRNARLSGYNLPGGCNHFPVGQARCDGRTTRTSDRPSHATSFPISDPVIHESGDRMYWNGLYGMNTESMDQLIERGRSWAYAPEIKVKTNSVKGDFDRSERCYRLHTGTETPSQIDLVLEAGGENPVLNPAFVVTNWGYDDAVVYVNGKRSLSAKTGIVQELDARRLMVFIPIKTEKETAISIRPR